MYIYIYIYIYIWGGGVHMHMKWALCSPPEEWPSAVAPGLSRGFGRMKRKAFAFADSPRTFVRSRPLPACMRARTLRSYTHRHTRTVRTSHGWRRGVVHPIAHGAYGDGFCVLLCSCTRLYCLSDHCHCRVLYVWFVLYIVCIIRISNSNSVVSC